MTPFSRPDQTRSDTLLVQLDDGTWLAMIQLPGQRIEVWGATRSEAAERALMVIAELDGDER